MQYLDEYDNNYKNPKFPRSCFQSLDYNNYNNLLDFHFNDVGCKINDDKYAKQAKTINDKSMFKNWKKIELALNILNIIIKGLSFVSLLFIEFKYLIKIDDSNDQVRVHTYLKFYFLIISIISCILFPFSIVFLYFHSNTAGTNQEIDLYKENGSNDFENNQVILFQ